MGDNHDHKNKDPLGREDPCKCRTWPEIWKDYQESIKANKNAEKVESEVDNLP